MKTASPESHDMFLFRDIVYKLISYLHRHFSENRAKRWHVALLMLFFMCLWWFKGVLAGLVGAFFVYVLTPDGPTRGWPALFAFIGIAIAIGLFGTFKSWQLYRSKVAEIAT